MKTGAIKTLLTLIVLTMTIIFPIGGEKSVESTLLTSLIVFILGLFLPHLLRNSSLYSGLTVKRPRWSEKIDLRNPLTYIQLIGIILLAAGFGGLIGGFLIGQKFNFLSCVFLFASFGVFLGIFTDLKKRQ